MTATASFTLPSLAGIASAGLKWWWAELVACAYPLARRLGYKDRRLFLTVDANGTLTSLSQSTTYPVLPHAAHPPGEPLLAGKQVSVSLAASDVFSLAISLPRAALSDLQSATRYKLIEESPIPIDQAYFATRVSKSQNLKAKAGMVLVEVAICKRAVAEAMVESLEQGAAASCVVGYSIQQQGPLDYVFLASEAAKATSRSKHVSQGLVISALAICLSGLPVTYLSARWLTHQAKQQIAEKHEQDDGRMKDYERQALARAAYRDLLAQTSSGPLTNVLNDIASRLPAHSWLQQLRLDGGKLQLQGHSRDITTSLQALSGAALLSQVNLSSVTGATTEGAPTQFEITAAVRTAEGLQ